MPSIFGCLSETYFRCCEQWFCFDKKIALYTPTDSFAATGKSHDPTSLPVVWSGAPAQVEQQPAPITQQPKLSLGSATDCNDKEPDGVKDGEKAKEEEEEDDDEAKEGRGQERRRSVSEIKLTIHDYEHDHRTDIPVIRQKTVPKFYIGTPEQTEFDWSRKPKTLAEQQQEQRAKEMNPYLTAFHFNLKTIRDMHLEPLPQQRALAAPRPGSTDHGSFSKLFNFKTKFKAFSHHQKRAGSRSVPNFPIYS